MRRRTSRRSERASTGVVLAAVLGSTSSACVLEPNPDFSASASTSSDGASEGSTSTGAMAGTLDSGSADDAPVGTTDGSGDGDPTCTAGVDCDASDDANEICDADVDCDPGLCEDGTCVLATSCAELLTLRPDTPDGEYSLDIGGRTLAIRCDMTTMGGGWAQWIDDRFDRGVPNGWSSAAVNTCGRWGPYLGPFGSDDEVQRTTDIAIYPHTELLVFADIFLLDSWDNRETVLISVDGQQVWQQTCASADPPICVSAGDICRSEFLSDGRVTASFVVASETPAPLLSFGSNLNQQIEDESFGIASLQLLVR